VLYHSVLGMDKLSGKGLFSVALESLMRERDLSQAGPGSRTSMAIPGINNHLRQVNALLSVAIGCLQTPCQE